MIIRSPAEFVHNFESTRFLAFDPEGIYRINQRDRVALRNVAHHIEAGIEVPFDLNHFRARQGNL